MCNQEQSYNVLAVDNNYIKIINANGALRGLLFPEEVLYKDFGINVANYGINSRTWTTILCPKLAKYVSNPS